MRYRALVPNIRGYDRFRAAGGIHMIAVFISVSETHNRKNVNRSVGEHLERLRPVIERARADAVPARAYVSTAFGCPDEVGQHVTNFGVYIHQLQHRASRPNQSS